MNHNNIWEMSNIFTGIRTTAT